VSYQTIIAPAALADNLDSPNWLILDCRAGTFYDRISYKKFLKGHIPKALYYCSTGNYLPDSGTTSSILCNCETETDQIIESLKELGFDETSQIIIYDDSSSSVTDSMWLLLRSIGCQHVAVLQGGFASWIEQEMPLASSKNSIEQSISA